MGRDEVWPNGWYVYMDDLRSIARRRTLPAWTVPAVLSIVSTPLKVANWARHLSSNPDLEFTAFLLCGIQEGFRVGFDYGRVVLKPSKSNMVSAREHPAIVSEYLQEECKNGRVIGPLDEESGKHVKQISRFGVIPKGHTPGKWRLIVDLSAPSGHSVSDGIESDLCALEYTSVDRAAALIRRLGQQCLLAKIECLQDYPSSSTRYPSPRHAVAGWRVWTQPSHLDCGQPLRFSMW